MNFKSIRIFLLYSCFSHIFLLAWKRNHDHLTSAKTTQITSTSQNAKAKAALNQTPEISNLSKYEHANLKNTKNSDKSKQKMIDTADIIDNGNLSSSTNSSFSSVASIKKKPNITNPRKTRKQDTPSPQIPPRAPVLETLKRTKRELVNNKSFRKGDNVNAKVINCN